MQAAATGQSVWKAVGISLLSSAASYGIGCWMGPAGNFWHEAARAGLHGLASGAAALCNKQNFLSAFVSGAASSGIGSFAETVNLPTGAVIGCTTVMGDLTSWATGGDIWQGAMNGLMIGALNHAQHEDDGYKSYQYGTNDDDGAEKYKAYLRYKISTDKNFKQKFIADIEKDGKLSFAEAMLWYQVGDGTPITVQASKLELRNLNVKQAAKDKGYNCFKWGNNLDEALVYGKISVTWKGGNTFKINTDRYDFNIEWNDLFTFRNFATFGAGILHGYGRSFNINFKGLWIKK